MSDPESHPKPSNSPPLRRRAFLRAAGRTTVALAAAGAAGTAARPRPAVAQTRMKWRMQTAWPKNFPGFGTGAAKLAQAIAAASDGRLTVEVFGAGEIVPAAETMDAVASGTVEMGHGAPVHWAAKMPAAQFLAAIPFGLNAVEQNAWMHLGGGQELADKVYNEMGCKFFASGNAGVQMGGWFNKEINVLADYKGLKMRIPGLGGEVVKAAGGQVISLPDAELPPALSSGAVDASAWFGPHNDLAFGLYKSAKFYYYPGWHRPSLLLDNFINLTAWERLPLDLQAVVAAANGLINLHVLSEFNVNNGAALNTLMAEHNVVVKKFPDEVLNGLGALSGQVLPDLAAGDPLSRAVMHSVAMFRKQSVAYAKLSEQAFYQARALPFDWVTL